MGPNLDEDFTLVLKDDLPCRFAHVRLTGSGVPTAPGGPIADRTLLWDPAYELPGEFVRVVVAASNSLPVGTQFQLIPGTLGAYRGPSGALAYRMAYLVRVG